MNVNMLCGDHYASDRPRNNGLQLEKFRSRREIGGNWFSNRVINRFNRLSNHIASAQTMDSFKRLDKFMDEDDRWN